MIRNILNWFKNKYTRETEHHVQLFELEKEHKYLEAAITQLWEYITVSETDLARRIAKLDPEAFKSRKKAFITTQEEPEQVSTDKTWKGVKVFGGDGGTSVPR